MLRMFFSKDTATSYDHWFILAMEVSRVGVQPWQIKNHVLGLHLGCKAAILPQQRILLSLVNRVWTVGPQSKGPLGGGCPVSTGGFRMSQKAACIPCRSGRWAPQHPRCAPCTYVAGCRRAGSWPPSPAATQSRPCCSWTRPGWSPGSSPPRRLPGEKTRMMYYSHISDRSWKTWKQWTQEYSLGDLCDWGFYDNCCVRPVAHFLYFSVKRLK